MTSSASMSLSIATWSLVYSSARTWVCVLSNTKVNLSYFSRHMDLPLTFRKGEKGNVVNIYLSLNTELDISTRDMFNSSNDPENKNSIPIFYQWTNKVIKQITDFPKNILLRVRFKLRSGTLKYISFLICYAASGHRKPFYIVTPGTI